MQQRFLLHQTKSTLCTSTTVCAANLFTKPHKFIKIEGEGQTTKVIMNFILIGLQVLVQGNEALLKMIMRTKPLETERLTQHI